MLELRPPFYHVRAHGRIPARRNQSDGSSEAYNRDKLFRGILTACAKRPVTPDQVDRIINDIESDLRQTSTNRIESKQLGERVLEKLADVDDVAYIRFASVYKDFKSIEEFRQALEEL